MSDATYGFLSVLRRGLAAMIPAGASGDARVSLPVSFSIGGAPVGSLPMLALRGAGDVVGFDTGAVRRTWPAADADNAEPNYFALIEFSEADLPWRYTPDAPKGDRLAPWICLIVLQESEVVSLTGSTAAEPFARLTVHDASVLPNLTQAWAWAHAQIAGGPAAPATDFSAAAVADLLAGNPAVLLSRLICPRRLDPRARYVACLVPSLERARLAGLGQPVDGVGRLAPAWTNATSPVTLPVYFSWRFQTAGQDDFASLVAKLTPAGDLPDTVWRRDFAVSLPGAGTPAWQTVGLEGALLTLTAQSPDWSTIDAHGFTAAMAAHTNVSGTTLAPTLYGRWLAASSALSTAADAMPRWFHQLNGDPRTRVAAGLGTIVIQTEQQELLAAAWAQVDGIRRINQRLRLSQLARELSLRVFTRHLAIAGDGFLQITAPFHAHVRNGPTTVGSQLDASPIVQGALAPVWRRVARPLGSLGVRQGRPSLTVSGEGAYTRMNAGTLAIVAPAPSAPITATGTERRLGNLAAAFAKVNVRPEALHHVSMPASFTVRESTVEMAGTTSGGAVTTATSVTGVAGGTGTTGATRTGGGVATTGTTGETTTAPPPTNIPPAAFAKAAITLMAQFAAAPAAGIQWTQADLGKVRSALLDGLNPKNTIETPLKNRLSGVSGGPTRTDPIEPVMAAPVFPQAMYEPLKELSQSWLIPGLEKVPANTVALLTTNWRFVEAFLVGLNHEMARKLLWNGYPTDQRGTYFSHFWDIRSRIDGTTAGDVGPIHQWSGELGRNHLSAIDPLVLLVRGELIRRYPNVVVYAAQAVAGSGGREPGSTEKHPIFYGRLEPDVALFAFDLAAAEARANPGWFFVLQEHPSEPRFGLAAPAGAWGTQPPTWQALGWDHLAASADALGAIRYIDLDAELPRNPANPDPAGAAWHGAEARAADLAHITLRQPKRFAVHGSVLIPAGTPA